MVTLLTFAEIPVPKDDYSRMLRNKAIREEMSHTFQGSWDRLGLLLEDLEEAFVTITMDRPMYTDARGRTITRDEFERAHTTSTEAKEATIKRRTTATSSRTSTLKPTTLQLVARKQPEEDSEEEDVEYAPDTECINVDEDEDDEETCKKPSAKPTGTHSNEELTTTTDLNQAMAKIKELERTIAHAKLAISVAETGLVKALDENRALKQGNQYYLQVVDHLFKIIDQERARSGFLRQHMKDVNTIEMIKRMGIADEDSAYYSGEFKNTWGDVLKTSMVSASFNAVYHRYRERLDEYLKEEYEYAIRISETQWESIVTGRHKLVKPDVEELRFRQTHADSMMARMPNTTTTTTMEDTTETTVTDTPGELTSNLYRPISNILQDAATDILANHSTSTQVPMANDPYQSDNELDLNDLKLEKVTIALGEDSKNQQSFVDDLTTIMLLLIRVGKRAIRTPIRNKPDADAKFPSYFGISEDKARVMGEWNTLWNSYLKKAYKSESSKVAMKLTVAIRGLQLATLGMYENEFWKACSPVTKKYLQGLSNPVQQPSKRVTVSTMITRWKNQPSDVAYINTDPAVMERFPGSLSNRFSRFQEPALCTTVPNLPTDHSTLSVCSSTSGDKRKRPDLDQPIKRKKTPTGSTTAV
jgi:hypothetical protein